MESERLYLAVFWAVSQSIVTVVLIRANRRAANGGLERNEWTGIRAASTMRSA